jgi:hypothetical protein
MSIRQILFSTIALAILPTAVLRAADTAEYVGGTVKSIPMNSIGFLNVDDTKVLKFNYGPTAYKLPYDQITGTEVTKSEARHVLKKLPVPNFGRKKETLTISYKDAAGVTGKLSFEVTARLASSVQTTIAEVKALPDAATVANDSKDWWGDKYWKTERNKGTWDASTASASQPAPATTPSTKN